MLLLTVISVRVPHGSYRLALTAARFGTNPSMFTANQYRPTGTSKGDSPCGAIESMRCERVHAVRASLPYYIHS